jgi:2-(1,2-epoxy-1,2-dihydrophenyl)acetyl-CoA isomerase
MPPVTLTIEGHLAFLTLNRPDRLNAINISLRDAFLTALHEINANAQVRCVVLGAEGRLFCAGQDLEERRPVAQGLPMDLGQALREGINRMILGLMALRQPVVGCLQGDAVGAGASLALACDLLVAADRARLHFSFAALGLGPDSGASWLLCRKAGYGRAAGLLLQARSLPAAEAQAWGLVSECVPKERLQAAARANADRIAALPPDAIAAGKRLLQTAVDNDLAAQLEAEAACQTALGHGETYKSRLEAFFSRK